MRWFMTRKDLALTLQGPRGQAGEYMLRAKIHWGHQALTVAGLFIAALNGLPFEYWAPFCVAFAFFMEGLDAFINSVKWLFVSVFAKNNLGGRWRRFVLAFRRWFSWWDVYDYSLPALACVGALFGPIGAWVGLGLDFAVWFVLLPREAAEDG